MPPTDGSLLPDRDFNQLQEIADQFAAARQAGPIDDWLPYVPAMSDPLHRPVLLELVKIDLDIGWRSGNGPLLEFYIRQFPELDPMPVELIVEEFRVRRVAGDNPVIEDYQHRFPDAYAQFEPAARLLPAQPPPKPAPAAGAGHQPDRRQATESARERPERPAPPVFPDGYTPLALLGRGNFGEVWRAEAPGGVEVAIKVITQPIDNDAAKRELQALELVKKAARPGPDLDAGVLG